jgi:hypothetical protein
VLAALARDRALCVRLTDSAKLPYIRHSDGTIRQGRSLPPESQWLERLAGRDMTFVRVDHQTRLQFGEFEVVIETPFRLMAPDGSDHNLDPGVRASLGPVLDLYPGALSTATVDSDGTLRLRLADGAALDVPASDGSDIWITNAGSDTVTKLRP